MIDIKEKDDPPPREFSESMRAVFLASLEAAKEIKPITPEWYFVWSSLNAYKTWAEARGRSERSFK